MQKAEDYYRLKLKEELAARLARNPLYSIRAMAKSLDVDAGTLSRVLAGKQIPSYKLTVRLTRALALSPQELEAFFGSVSRRQKRRKLQRLTPLFASHVAIPPSRDLSIDLYRIIADWYHFAILELTYVKGFKSDEQWIAKELGISPLEAKLAVDRLLEFQLLKKERGTLVKTEMHLSTTDKHVTTAALRKNQRQFLEKAIDSLDGKIDTRSSTSMTMAIDPRKIPTAKKMIQEFNQKLCRYLEDGERTTVYNLQVALYPLQMQNPESKK